MSVGSNQKHFWGILKVKLVGKKEDLRQFASEARMQAEIAIGREGEKERERHR